MAKGMEDMAEHDDILGIMKNGGGLGFSCRTNNMSETSTFDKNWMVGSARDYVVWIIFEIIKPGDSTSSLWRNKVGGIGIDMQVHIASVIPKDDIRKCGDVVQ